VREGFFKQEQETMFWRQTTRLMATKTALATAEGNTNMTAALNNLLKSHSTKDLQLGLRLEKVFEFLSIKPPKDFSETLLKLHGRRLC
jgi:hypothetical protein